jgi:uncharacterized membrane protein
MHAQRAGARIATILALAAGVVVIGPTPAVAADDTVDVRLPTAFVAGDPPVTVSVFVEKRTSGCTRVRTALAFRLAGLPADQVKVEVRDDGDWRSVGVTDGGDGLIVTERTAPDRSYLCRRRDTSARYRVAFLGGAPAGRVTVVAEAYAAGGGLMDRDAGTRTVVNRNGPTPSASAAVVGAQASGTTGPSAAAAAPGLRSTDQDENSFGLNTLVMLLGVAMVGVGIALLAMLIRRSRAEPDEPRGYAYTDPLPYLPRAPTAAPAPPSTLPPPLAPPPRAKSFGGDTDSTLILPKPVD